MTGKYSPRVAFTFVGALAMAAPLFAQPAERPRPSSAPVPAVQPMPLPPLEPLVLTPPQFDVLALQETARTAAIHAREAADSAAALVGRTGTLGDLRMDFELEWSGRGQTSEEREKAREAAGRQREQGRENRAYEEGYRHVSEGRWDRAIERFDDVVAGKGQRADAALYWKAYAQDRSGQRAEALATIATLTREFPDSRYLQQARALEAEVRRNAGQPVNPQAQADEELKLMAIAALQHQAPEQAVPMLEKILSGNASPKLKERALFVLAQSDSPRAREVLKGAAKGNSTPELQSRAISYLGTHGGAESRAILSEVYGSTSDVEVKKRILRAFMVAGEKDRLLTASQTEQNPELRATAIQQLGVMGAHAELSQLYAKETSVENKKRIIQAMFVGGNSTRMIELARTEPNPELRRTAIRNLGLMGGKANADTLMEIYASDQDVSVKKAVIQALALNDNAATLVTLARKEKDPVLHKEMVQRLSHMDSKVAVDYMLEILNK